MTQDIQKPIPAYANEDAENEIVSIVTQIEENGIIVLFSYIDDETSVLEATITDNYVETNHSVQDHIAIKPKIYRLRGCVGEVVYKGSAEWTKWMGDKINSNPILEKTLKAIKPIGAISGIVSNATQSAIAVVNQLESSYNRYKKMIENNYFNAPTFVTGKIQESVVADLNRILELRLPVNLKGLRFNTVLTGGDNYERKYYLQSVSAHQGNNAFISDIEVTIKEVRVATTQVTKIDKKIAGQTNDVAVAKTPETNTGNTTGNQLPAEQTREMLETTENNIKNATKEALKGHPILYKAVSGLYHGIKLIGETALKGQTYR